jgi:hypothetical protein
MGWVGLFLFLFFGGAVGIVIWIQIARVRSHRRRQLQVWGAIAQRRGVPMGQAMGVFGHHWMVVPAAGRQVRVHVTNGIAIDRAAASKYRTAGGWHTIVDVAYQSGSGPGFSITPGRARKGGPTFGDPVLDQRYEISDAKGDLAAIWTPRAKELLQQADLRRTWLVSGGNIISAVIPGVFFNEGQLELLIELVTELSAAREGTTAAA